MAERDTQPASEGESAPGTIAKRLPAGRHAPPREFVVRSQRDRLLDAMAHVCAANGYGAATVEAVTARARVSSRTFYEQFKDREDCFVAAYDAILAQFLGRVIPAYEQLDLEWPARICAAIAAKLAFLASEPAFATMCILEVLAAGDRARERYESAVGVLAALLDEGRAFLRDPDELPAATATDVIEGAAFLIRAQILAGRTREIETLLPDLTYAALVPYLGQDGALRHCSGAPGNHPRPERGAHLPAITVPSPPPPRTLPAAERGREQHWREQARRARRERMLEAMTDTVAERGYHNTGMVEVAARAGVARATLRQQFGDKEGLFIAAHDWLLERLANYVAPAYQEPGPWPGRISRALAALLTAIAYRPQGARVAIIEVLAAGSQARQHHLAAIETFTRYIDEGRDQTPFGKRLPPNLAEIVAGAVAARIDKHVATGHTSELPQLHPQLLYLVLLPYLGHRQAQQHMQRPPSG